MIILSSTEIELINKVLAPFNASLGVNIRFTGFAWLASDVMRKVGISLDEVGRSVCFYYFVGRWYWMTNHEMVDRSRIMEPTYDEACQLHAIYCRCFDDKMGTVTVPYYDPQRTEMITSNRQREIQ